MGLLLRFFASFVFIISFWAQGQTFEYKLEGTFSRQEELPPSNPVIINYTMSWNESANSIQGIYRDNYYSNQNPNTVTGTIDSLGRTFTVILPSLVNGVKTITIKTSQTGIITGNISTNIRTTDDIGSEVGTTNTFALMSALTTSGPTGNDFSCSIGFGALTGFCGLYGGKFTELTDSQNRCHLLMAGNPRLELGTDTNFTLYLNYIDTTNNLPFHALGTFIASPQETSIAASRRHCGSLPGTNFTLGNCLNLALNANFFNTAGNATISGSYTITDEITKDACSYSLFLTREVAY